VTVEAVHEEHQNEDIVEKKESLSLKSKNTELKAEIVGFTV